MKAKTDSVASIFASDEAIEFVKKKRDSRGKNRVNRKSMGRLHGLLAAKDNYREQVLRHPEGISEAVSEYSETAQQSKMRKAAEKRARKSGL